MIQKNMLLFQMDLHYFFFDEMELHSIINGKVENNWQMQFHLRNFKCITSMDIH
jgi:hypothetical protein